MKDSSVHIIDKVTVDIEVTSTDEAHELQRSMQSFINDRVLPVVEAYLEEVTVTGVHVVIDKLDLQFDAELVNSPFWKEDIIQQLDKRFVPLQETIKSVENASIENTQHAYNNHKEVFDEQGRTEVRSTSNSNLQAIGYFLSTGKAPWWMNTASEGLPELLDEKKIVSFFEQREFRTHIGKILRDQPNARKRFVHQFSSVVQLEWLLRLTHDEKVSPSQLNLLKETLKELDTEYKVAQKAEIWFAIHTFVLEKTIGNSTMNLVAMLDYLMKFVEINRASLTYKRALELLRHRLSKNQAITTQDVDLLQHGPALFLFVVASIHPLASVSPITNALSANLRLKSKSNRDTRIDNSEPRADIKGAAHVNEEENALENNSDSDAKKNALESSDKATSLPKDSDAASNSEEDEIQSKRREAELDASKPEREGMQSSDEETKSATSESNEDHAFKSDQKTQDEIDTETGDSSENLASKLESEWNEKKSSKLSEFEHIECAGGVLLHPFYMPLFAALNYLDEERMLIAPQRAIHLIHYLITGETGVFESQMQFAKFICGLDPSEIIDRTIELTDEEKTQAQHVLDSALAHWTALKSNSRELLQNEFLKRPGKISMDGDYLRIMVEKKTVDILLNQLPWNLTMIKLPWFESVIYVEWNQ